MDTDPKQKNDKHTLPYEPPSAIRLGDLQTGGGGPTGVAACIGTGSGDFECISGSGADDCNTGTGFIT